MKPDIELEKRLKRLETATTEKGTDDCFDDSLVGPVEDEYGNPILDPVKLMAMGYSV